MSSSVNRVRRSLVGHSCSANQPAGLSLFGHSAARPDLPILHQTPSLSAIPLLCYIQFCTSTATATSRRVPADLPNTTHLPGKTPHDAGTTPSLSLSTTRAGWDGIGEKAKTEGNFSLPKTSSLPQPNPSDEDVLRYDSSHPPLCLSLRMQGIVPRTQCLCLCLCWKLLGWASCAFLAACVVLRAAPHE